MKYKGTAQAIRKCEYYKGYAVLYKVKPALKLYDKKYDYVVVSSVCNERYFEAYIFGSDETGIAWNSVEMDGSEKYTCDHDKVFKNIKYKIINSWYFKH